MFIKNLLRRKIRTLLTVLGIAIGVAAIIGLGALSNGLKAGYGSMLKGSKADLVLSQPNAMDISYSTVDEELGKKLVEAPEVSEVSAMLQGFTEAENQPFFFVFGYPADSFSLQRFQIIAGAGLDSRQAATAHGKPVLLGSAAAEVLKKSVGETLRLTGSIYRIIGIYQTGDAFEDSGAVMSLKDAQDLLGRQRQVSLFYIRLKDPGLRERFLTRVERQWPDFSVSGIQEFSEKQSMTDWLEGFVWAIGGLAIVIGGVGMMNAQLMAIMERTREIGVLRAVGWSSQRVLVDDLDGVDPGVPVGRFDRHLCRLSVDLQSIQNFHCAGRKHRECYPGFAGAGLDGRVGAWIGRRFVSRLASRAAATG